MRGNIDGIERGIERHFITCSATRLRVDVSKCSRMENRDY